MNRLRKNPAVLFKRKVYVGFPHHKDALDIAFAKMSDHTLHRIYDRVREGKEKILFGFAMPDGSGWTECEEFTAARLRMYFGF